MRTDERTINEIPLDEVIDKPMGGKTNIILDATILTALMECPRKTDFRFNHNFVSISGKSNSLECGSIVHVFLEYYYRSLISGTTKEQAIGYGHSAAMLYISGCPGCSNFIPSNDMTSPGCGHKVNEFEGVKNTPKDNEEYKTGWQYTLDTCEQYLDFYKNDHWVPLEVEIVKGEILYEDDEVRILWKAKFDLIVDTNQGVYPVDHKTMKQNRKSLSLNNQFMGQCILMKTRNVFINKIGFQKTLPANEKFIRSTMSYGSPRLFEWQSEILPFYGKLLLMYAETGYWPPNFNSCEGKYGYCAFHSVCEADPSMREEELRLNFAIGSQWNPQNENENKNE